MEALELRSRAVARVVGPQKMWTESWEGGPRALLEVGLNRADAGVDYGGVFPIGVGRDRRVHRVRVALAVTASITGVRGGGVVRSTSVFRLVLLNLPPVFLRVAAGWKLKRAGDHDGSRCPAGQCGAKGRGLHGWLHG